MLYKQRQKGSRRWEQYAEFPLKDSEGGAVHGDRRMLADRRNSSASSYDLAVLFSQMPANDAER
jgi:hypothetical protein